MLYFIRKVPMSIPYAKCQEGVRSQARSLCDILGLGD